MANTVEVILRAKDEATGVFKDVEKGAGGLGGTLGTLGKVAGGIAVAGIVAAGAAAVGLGKALADCVGAAMEAETVQAALTAVIKATGGAAGVTSEMANGLATALESVTRFEDETILSAEGVLLRFRSIGKEVFPTATKAALDLATVMGVDASTAATTLGKALETPGEGLLRLKAAGLVFEDEEVKMLQAMTDAGRGAEAQAIILDRLNKSIGGAAEAAGNTFAGKLDILSNKFGAIKEQIGLAVIPALSSVADTLINVLASEAVQTAVTGVSSWITDNLVPSIAGVATMAGGLIANLAGALTTGDWSFVTNAITLAWEQVKLGFVKWATGFWDWLISTDGAMADVRKVFDAVAKVMSDNWPIVKSAIIGWAGYFWEWLTGPDGAVKWVGEKLGELGGKMLAAGSAIWTAIKGWAVDFWLWLTGAGGAVESAPSILSIVGAAMAAAGGSIWTAILGWGTSFWQWLTGPGGSIDDVSGQLTTIGVLMGASWTFIGSYLSPWAGSFWEWLTGPAGAIADAPAQINKVADSLKAASTDATFTSTLASIGETIGGGMFDWLINPWTLAALSGKTPSGVLGDLFTPADTKTGVIAWIMNLDASIENLKTSIGDMGIAIVGHIIGGMVKGIAEKGLATVLTEMTSKWDVLDFTPLGSSGWAEVAKGFDRAIQDAADWFTKIGADIVAGIATGITDAEETLKTALDTLVAKLPAWAKTLLGISSPSTVFAEIGEQIVSGLIQGIESTTGHVDGTIKELVTGTFKAWYAATKSMFGSFGSNFRRMFQEFMGDYLSTATFGIGDTVATVLRQMAVRIAQAFPGSVGAAVIPAMEVWITQLGDQALLPAIANVWAKVDAIFSRAGVLSGLGSAAATRYQASIIDPLQAGVEALKAEMDNLTKSGPIDESRLQLGKDIATQQAKVNALEISYNKDAWKWRWDIREQAARNIVAENAKLTALKAQRDAVRDQLTVTTLLTEQNAKLLEAQEKVAALAEQQADLSFLQSQLEFIKMIRENGLNMQNILGGLKLGLQADLPGLLTAMTTAMQQLIAAAENEMGIHSPSKVFAAMGQNIMAAFGAGSLRAAPAAAGMVGAGMRQVVNNTTNQYNLSANYKYESQGSLIDRIKVLRMLTA